MIDRVADVLTRMESPGSFVARRSLSPAALSLSVKGVGPIGLPVSAVTAQQLCAVGTQAPFGRGAETVVDTSVRDTWEIGSQRVRTQGRGWGHTLSDELSFLRAELGLPQRARLVAELHKMLVYGPGQFFLPHQDSEKCDDMVATLLVVLPSQYRGGDLVISNGSSTRRFAPSKRSAQQIDLIAFYADCRHEVRPVEEGYRVVLSYNLRMQGELEGRAEPGRPAPADLQAEIERYFATPAPQGWSRQPASPPDRLVYLLDHEYTPRGLSWKRLKNGDARRANALRASAEALGCGVAVALADVHEVWGCEDDGHYGGRWGAPRRPTNRDPSEYDLLDLHDEDITLGHAKAPSGKAVPGHEGYVPSRQVCSTRPSVELTPYDVQHEGYMGNWGNTVDRWYHRGAIVLWPKDREFVIRAKGSLLWAVEEIAKLMRGGDLTAARTHARAIVPFFRPPNDCARLFSQTLEVAAGLEDADLAADLCRPFDADRITDSAVAQIPALLEAYGLDWCEGVLSSWREGRIGRQACAFPSLVRLCEVLHDAGSTDGLELGAWAVRAQWAHLKSVCEAISSSPPANREAALSQRHVALLDVFESRFFAAEPEVAADIDHFFLTVDLPPLALTALLSAALDTRSKAVVPLLGLANLADRCRADLQAVVEAPPRAATDWSMSVDLDCDCELCGPLRAFLADRTREEWAWPINKESRRHVHSMLERYALPVSHDTLRRGRPFTLELVKLQALFTREAEHRQACVQALRWFEGHRAAFD